MTPESHPAIERIEESTDELSIVNSLSDIRITEDDGRSQGEQDLEEVHSERVFEGIGVAPGFAIGPVYLYARDLFTVEERRITEEELEAEVRRFERAVAKSERDLNKIAAVAREKIGEHSAGIFEAQALMLRDSALYQAVVDFLRENRVNVDYAVHAVMSKHRQLLKASDNEYLRERANDLLDLQDRIIRHLRRGKIMSDVDAETIVVAENLTAADIVLFSRRGILGTALDYGGATSHVSIMARALRLPSVVSLHGITESVESGDIMILDGLDGRVIVNPEPATLDFYRTRRERYARLLQEQKQLLPLASETLDGHPIKLMANLEFKEELGLLAEYGARGIGLFRTEILFLMQRRISLSEDEQFNTYKEIVEATRPEVTTFRVLDLGGDKMLPMGHREPNPFLGWRGIRVLLDRPELLRPQVRAILRTSAHGPVRILLPMITHLKEIAQFRAIFDEVKEDLRAEGLPFAEDVPLGIMVEVPAVALTAERFAREVDFFSIGTNDLTQYTLAVDRGNDLVADKYEELHPAVLTLVQKSVCAARLHGIPISVCGEMASNPRATPVLIGLGVDELSASPVYLPEVKRVVRAIKLDEAQKLAEEALTADDASEVHALLDAWLNDHACGLVHLMEQETA